MKPLATDTVLQDRYKIDKLIGRGGMGEVYLAVDQRLGHSIALKRTNAGDDPMLTAAFEREAKILAELRHAVLPKVSDHFTEQGEQYLVMEYISGDDLHNRLKISGKPFPLDWVLFWADQLLEALTYLHTHEPPIIHRDIKPQNLKVTSDKQIVLLDFGLSKNSLDKTRATTSGSVVGYTPHYAPMEQIRGTGTNPQSDVYSLSATLYQLLTNVVPPDALTRADSLLAGAPDPIKPLNEINDEVSELLSSVILKGLNLSQQKRFDTARDMQKALRNAFNKLQEAMSAKTVAFNMGDEKVSKSDLKTEVIPVIPQDVKDASVVKSEAADQAASESTPEAIPPENDFSSDKTEVIDASQIRGIVNDEDVDSTMGENIVPQEEDPTGMKTEVYMDDEAAEINDRDYSAKEEISEIPDGEGVEDEESFVTSDDISADAYEAREDASDAGSHVPDATVPIISFDDSGDKTQGDEGSAENVAEDAAVGAFGLTENIEVDDHGDAESEEVVDVKEEQDEELVAAPAAASTGKYVALLGGLGVVLFILLGSVFAIGWYFTDGNFGFAGTDNTSPSPQPTVTETAEPDQTPDDSDTTLDDITSNTANEDLTNTSTKEDANSNSTPEVETPLVTTPQVTPRRTPKVTPRKTPRATTRRTPRKTPRRTPRKKPKKDPGILQ